MKDYSYHKKVIDDVITKLNESDIDLYLIITAEGCDRVYSRSRYGWLQCVPVYEGREKVSDGIQH